MKDENDKEGYEIVRKARIECKNLRVLATKIAKAGRELRFKEAVQSYRNMGMPEEAAKRAASRGYEEVA